MRQNSHLPLVLSGKMVKETSMAEHEVAGTKMTSLSDLPGDKSKKRRTKTERVKLFKERVKTGVREEREITDLQSRYETIDTSLIKNFRDFPLSKKTLRGLSDSGYKVPTDIQKEAIGLALRKLDVLGAAQTGSGKTLAFLVPILEILYCKSWTRLDGLGAIIITPTRELAYQIFETLRKIGRHHEFSAGLIIGGKDMKYESRRLHQCNIMICTPGRLLHHMDENPLLDPTSLQMLVIDEADRCLDLGFQHTMNGIIENLPPNRQTLLFSATQTKSVKDLARLSLKDPMYVSVHEHAKHSTPEGLQQSYMVSPAEHKIDLLWSFVKNHRKHKTIVFLTSCKQVRFAHHAFCRLRPGYSIMALHGGLHQLKRMAVYEEFCRKEHAVLLATDIAARGLDFPDVNWVLQLDCPEDAASYVHRAGRTARYTQGGEALLVLLPSEEQAMLERLKERKVPINKIEVNPRKLVSIQRKLEAMLARDTELKAMAQRALVTYMKATFLMKDKSVFDVSQIDLQALSRSYGLAVAPRVRFLQKQGITLKKPQTDSDEAQTEPERGTDALAQGKDITTFDFGIEESDEDILMVKRKDHALSDDDYEDLEEEKKKKNRILTKEAVAKRILKKKIKANKSVQFDEEGDRIFDPIKERVTEAARNYEFGEDDLNTTSGINIEKAREILREEDQVDKQVFRARIKAKHREERLKAKAERRQASQPEEEEAEDVEAAYESDDSVTESVADIIDALPDPDRIYGAKEGDHESESEEEENFVAVEPKRKKKSVKSVKAKKRKLESATFDSGLDLQDEEQLALQLLQH